MPRDPSSTLVHCVSYTTRAVFSHWSTRRSTHIPQEGVLQQTTGTSPSYEAHAMVFHFRLFRPSLVISSSSTWPSSLGKSLSCIPSIPPQPASLVRLVGGAVLKVGATLLTTLISMQGGPTTPRARDPGLHRPPSHTLSLNSSRQPTCQ